MEQLVLRCAGAPVRKKLQFSVLIASAVNHITFPAYGMTVMGDYLLFLHQALRPVLSLFFTRQGEYRHHCGFCGGQEIRDNSQHRTGILLHASLQITSWVSRGSDRLECFKNYQMDCMRDLQEVFPWERAFGGQQWLPRYHNWTWYCECGHTCGC